MSSVSAEQKVQQQGLVNQARDLAVAHMRRLDEQGKWDEIRPNELPAEVLTYVAESISERPLDTIRKDLGIPSNMDPRWRKIMAAIKGGIRIDGTGVMLKWLRRNEQIATKIETMVDRMMEGEWIPSKMLIASIDTMANLQLSTIKMGKELGVFMDAGQAAQAQGQGGQQQIVIQVMTNVPTPSRVEIQAHQADRLIKNQKLLAEYAESRESGKDEMPQPAKPVV